MRAVRLLTIAALVLPAAARAQVGHLPEPSPFRDLEFRQSVATPGGAVRAPGAADARPVPRTETLMRRRRAGRCSGPARRNAIARGASGYGGAVRGGGAWGPERRSHIARAGAMARDYQFHRRALF